MEFVDLVGLLPGPEQLALPFLLDFLQFGLKLLDLLVFGSKCILQFLYLWNDDLVFLLELLHLVPQVLVLSLLLLQLPLILLANSFPQSR